MGRGSLSAAACVAACVLLASGTTERPAESKPTFWAKPGHKHVLYAAPGDVAYSYGPKNDKLTALTGGANVDAPMTVTFNGFSAEAQAAFQAAVNIWSNTLDSSIPIRIRANWTPLASNVLGSAGPTVLCSSNAFVPDTWYAAALADKLNGSNYCAALGGDTVEIEADFNSNFASWEFGTSGSGVPNQYNFMSVVLHEIGHGLGIFGNFTSNGTSGNLPGNPAIYDRFAVTGASALLLDIARPSAALHAQLTGSDTYWSGSNATSRNGGTRAKLETHHFTNDFSVTSNNGWLAGSSYSHVDDVLYTGTANGLMTWRLNSQEAYTDVGPITKGILQDQGWGINEDVPGAPTLLSPSGATTETTPDFIWNEVVDATGYTVYVRATNNATPIVNTLYAASALCSGGTCTLPAPVSLAVGTSYEWWVRGSNASGNGPWSATGTFTVNLPAPGATTVTGPTGSNIGLQPAYTWNAVSGATYYWLVVTQGANTIYQQWYTSAQASCSSSCSVTPSVTLTGGLSYNVRVQTWNTGGYGPWSSTHSFTAGSVPGVATLSTPSTTIDTPAPTYTWNAVSGATSYYLWVERTGVAAVLQATYAASSVCSGSVCSVTPQTELVDGAHRWFIQTIGTGGSGPWSAARTFTVSATTPGVTTTVWPQAGVHGTTRPTYRWNRVAGATTYLVWVDTGGGTPLVQTSYFSGAVCGVSVCSVTPAVSLTAGLSYRYYVRASSSRGTGPWNAGTVFSIATTAPGVATLVSPSGAIATANPTYTWNRVASATYYYLWVEAPGSALIQTWYRAEDVCAGSTCSVTPAVNVPASQTYRFFVQTWNDFGYGPWSTPATFTR